MTTIEEKHYGKAEEVRKTVFGLYKDLVDSISDVHFQPMADVVKAETGKSVDIKTAIGVFKASLYGGIESKLKSSWKELEVDTSLASLSYSKELATDESKKWRPTGTTTEEKLRPVAFAVKTRKKAVLERQIQYQSKVIEDLVMEVAQERLRLNLQERNCKNIIEQIESKHEKDDKVNEQIDLLYQAWEDKNHSSQGVDQLNVE